MSEKKRRGKKIEIKKYSVHRRGTTKVIKKKDIVPTKQQPSNTNQELDATMLNLKMFKGKTIKRRLRSFETKRDYEVEETIVKNKGGGFSLREIKTAFKLYHKSGDIALGEQETTYYKTTGLLKYLGDNIAWASDMTYLPKISKRKYNTEGHRVRNSHLEGTQSSRRFELDLSSKSVENTISEYTPDIGMKIGIDVHSEIEKFIQHGPEIFKKICPNPDPLTEAILSALGKIGYIGIHAEYPIYLKEKKTQKIIASSVDFVCVKQDAYKRQNVILIELKTGYSNGTFYTSFQKKENEELAKNGVHIFGDNKMLNEFSDLKDIPLNRARIQLITYMMYFKEKLNIECSGSVLHCSSDGVVKFFDIEDGLYFKYSKIIKTYLHVIRNS